MTEQSSTHGSLKVRPRVWIGLAIHLGYIIVVFAGTHLLNAAFGQGIGPTFEIVAGVLALIFVAFVIRGANERFGEAARLRAA